MFTKKNYLILGLAVLALVGGYILLGQGPANNPLSLSVAPIVLVLVYCGLIPFAILAKGKSQEEKK